MLSAVQMRTDPAPEVCLARLNGLSMARHSTVLNSPRAIAVNIEIMRAFVRLRLRLASNQGLARRVDRLEAKTDAKFITVIEAIRQLMAPPEPKQRPMGFLAAKEKWRP